MTHQIEFDFSGRSTPALLAKLKAAIENEEIEVARAVNQELEKRGVPLLRVDAPDLDPA